MGTLVTVAFTSAMKLLNFLKPKPTAPNIDVYGEPSIEPDQAQALMEWLFASLMAAGYFGKSHFIWYDSDKPDPRLEQEVKKLLCCGVSLLCCIAVVTGQCHCPRGITGGWFKNTHPCGCISWRLGSE